MTHEPQTTGLPYLPDWDQCREAIIAGKATAIQTFIFNNEPQEDADVFRLELTQALMEAKNDH